MREISCLDEDVLVCQEDLCCMELVSQAVGWLVSGTRLPWRQSFSEYTPHELEKFLEDGVTKFCMLLLHTDKGGECNTDTFMGQTVVDSDCHLPCASVTTQMAHCMGTE